MDTLEDLGAGFNIPVQLVSMANPDPACLQEGRTLQLRSHLSYAAVDPAQLK